MPFPPRTSLRRHYRSASAAWPVPGEQRLFRDAAVARLAAAQPLIDRLLDDYALDMLTGASGTDLFAVSVLDRIIDLKAQDLVARI